MSLTTGASLKALIETMGLGISVFNSRAPEGQKRPYVTIQERIALAGGPLEDGGAGTATETVQVELWQSLFDKAGKTAEDSNLLAKLEHSLHGARANTIGGVPVAGPGTGGIVYRCLVRNSTRLEEVTENLCRNVVTVEVKRQF